MRQVEAPERFPQPILAEVICRLAAAHVVATGIWLGHWRCCAGSSGTPCGLAQPVGHLVSEIAELADLQVVHPLRRVGVRDLLETT
jgi:hypothetical protein